MRTLITRSTLFLLTCFVPMYTLAAPAGPVVVSNAWTRPTVPGQTSDAAFMEIASRVDVQLTGVDSGIAGVAQVHEMSMDAGIMRMRAVPSVSIAHGTSVALTPTGMHVMLLDLKRPLRTGEHFAMTLHFRNADGKAFDENVDVQVHPDLR